MINGKAFWFKAAGTPHANKFNPQVPQWSFDLSVDDTIAQALISKGMKKSYLRDKQDERGTFLTFTRDSIKKDGAQGKPFKIVNAQNNPWDDNVKIGNGSELNVVVTLNERTFRGEKFLKPSAVAIQVWNLIEYDASNFPTKEPDTETIEDIEDVAGTKAEW